MALYEATQQYNTDTRQSLENSFKIYKESAKQREYGWIALGATIQ